MFPVVFILYSHWRLFCDIVASLFTYVGIRFIARALSQNKAKRLYSHFS